MSRASLLRLSPGRLPGERVDVLVLGAGAAGLRAAIEAGARLRTAVVAKGRFPCGNTYHAQGGVAAPLAAGDSVDRHVRDTLTAGRGLCDERAVRTILGEGPEAIGEIARWGARFDRHGGDLALGLEGGHSHPRIVHHGDRTGRELYSVLLARARRHAGIREETFALDLWVERGRCAGAILWNPARGFHALRAEAVLLATGGAGQVFRETTNPEGATGDGIAMAWRAGAEVRDLEFMQFHPTALYVAGAERALVSEAVRGAGAVLRDRTGRAFLEGGDLAPRDEVARAILRRMVELGDTQVYLDLSPIGRREIERKFPGLAELCRRFGLRLGRDGVPVRPAAHYTIGGVRTDTEGRTSLRGLWAAGECASTGLHGANRLGSNSLLECVVMGRRAARAILAEVRPGRTDRGAGRSTGVRAERWIDVADLTMSLRSLMWRQAGLVRDARTLAWAKGQIEFWARYARPAAFDRPEGWELQNLLDTAALMVRPALAREESRGAHARADFPKPRRAWEAHLVGRGDRWRRAPLEAK